MAKIPDDQEKDRRGRLISLGGCVCNKTPKPPCVFCASLTKKEGEAYRNAKLIGLARLWNEIDSKEDAPELEITSHKETLSEITPEQLSNGYRLLLIALAKEAVRIEGDAQRHGEQAGHRNKTRAEDCKAIARNLRRKLARNATALRLFFGTLDPHEIAEAANKGDSEKK